MKKSIFALADLAAITACSDIDTEEGITITTGFEDAGDSRYWAELIDSPQFGGSLIYSDMEYNWNGNGFSHSLKKADWGNGLFGWDSGAAISNYVGNGNEDYTSQLAVRGSEGKAGNKGSANFAVWFGHDYESGASSGSGSGSGSSSGNMAEFVLDREGELVDMYVCNTAYGLSSCYDEAGNCIIQEDEQVSIVLNAVKKDGTAARREFLLVNGPDCIVDRWTRWDLSGMGNIVSFSFNVTGNITNDYGFAFPAYFAFDDVRIRFKE